MKIEIVPLQECAHDHTNIIDVLEGALGLPSSHWSGDRLRKLARSEWLAVFESVKALYKPEGGIEWLPPSRTSQSRLPNSLARVFQPYKKNARVIPDTVIGKENAVYINTNGYSPQDVVSEIKKRVLFYDVVYFEEPIAQLGFDNGFAGAPDAGDSHHPYRLSIDQPDRWVLGDELRDLHAYNKTLIHYEGIRQWVQFYSEIAPLIRRNIVVPLSNHGDFAHRYLLNYHSYTDLHDERAFDKEDGFRTTEDVIASLYFEKTFDRNIIKQAFSSRASPVDRGSSLCDDTDKAVALELLFSELISRQFAHKIIPSMSLSKGAVAYEILRGHLNSAHKADFLDHAVEAYMIANYVPNPAAIEVSDALHIRDGEEIFQRWRDSIANCIRKTDLIDTAEKAKLFCKEVEATSLSWHAEFERALPERGNLSAIFRSFPEKAVVGIFSAAGVGLFDGKLATGASTLGGYLIYDLLLTVNDRLRSSRRRKQLFALKRVYGAFEQK